MNFFENPVIEIEDALSKLVTFGHPDQVRGQAYLITGLLRGLGVDFIE